jgi:hypothetical protein
VTAHDDAVKTAAEAGQGVSHDFLVECGLTDNEADAAINAVAEAAVAAAAPILLAAERTRIAAAIRAEVMLSPFSGGDGVHEYNLGATQAQERAARIAETTPEEGP